MDTRQLTAVLLIVVPVLFNVAFFELLRAFDYPAILRQRAGRDPVALRGRRSRSALALAGLLLLALGDAAARGPRSGRARAAAGLAAVVDRRRCRRCARPGSGSCRWPFAVPELARRYLARRRPRCRGDAPDGRSDLRRPPSLPRRRGRRAPRLPVDGLWTLLAGARSCQPIVLPVWLAITGLAHRPRPLIGTLEFVGPNERDGWRLAGTIVPIAYIALVALARRARGRSCSSPRSSDYDVARPEWRNWQTQRT